MQQNKHTTSAPDGVQGFESDKTTEIGTYKEVSLNWNDTEVGDEHRGVFNDYDNSFTFDSGRCNSYIANRGYICSNVLVPQKAKKTGFWAPLESTKAKVD